MHATTFATALDMPEHVPYAVDLTALSAHLATLVDQRKRRGIRYPLVPMLMIALLAKLAGSARLADIAAWATLRAPELAHLFGLRRRTMPHITTWSRLLGQAVDPDAFTAHLRQFLLTPQQTNVVPERGSSIVAVDGKTLRGTIPFGHTSGVHLVAAYQPDTGIVLAQLAVGEKANEIVAMPQVIAQLDLEGVVVVGDAMQTQRALSTHLVERGGDYMWFVKENQKTLLEDIVQLFTPLAVLPGTSDPPTDVTQAHTVEVGHGRIEQRTITVSSALQDYCDWPYVAQVFKLERTSCRKGDVPTPQDGKTTRKGGKRTRKGSTCTKQVTTDVRYGVTSLPATVATAKRLLAVARAEWQIENRLHYRRDVTLHEDASQLRRGRGPQVLAVLNNAVLGLTHGQPNLADFQRTFSFKFERLLAYIAFTTAA